MTYTSEQKKRLTVGLLENSRQVVQQMEFSSGGGHGFSYTQQPIELTDTLTPGHPKLYGLVFVFVSTQKEEVTALAEAIDGMQIRG